MEFYRYLLLRELYSDKIGCRHFAVGEAYYLDELFFRKRKEVRNFLVSELPLVGSHSSDAGKQAWNQAKGKMIQSILAGDANSASSIEQIKRTNSFLWNVNVASEVVMLLTGTSDLWKNLVRSLTTKAKTVLLRKSAQVVETQVTQAVEVEVVEVATSNIAGSVGTYTTKIKWGILDIDARPFGNKGYWGKKVTQSEARVEALELKINPNNESFYIEHPNGGFVQFENLSVNALQDGKMVLQPSKSLYRVYTKPEFLRQKALDEAIRVYDKRG